MAKRFDSCIGVAAGTNARCQIHIGSFLLAGLHILEHRVGLDAHGGSGGGPSLLRQCALGDLSPAWRQSNARGRNDGTHQELPVRCRTCFGSSDAYQQIHFVDDPGSRLAAKTQGQSSENESLGPHRFADARYALPTDVRT